MGSSGPTDAPAGADRHGGRTALREGRWDDAARAFQAELDDEITDDVTRADMFDGLADARWWLGDVRAAVTAREQVYRARRSAGDHIGAARAAAWLAREHAAALGNMPLARGWLARAETTAGPRAEPGVAGWIALAHATLADAVDVQTDAATRALEHARVVGDGDLEVLALARLGLALVSSGSPELGLARMDEALAAATGGDAEGVTTEAQLCCDLVLAADLCDDRARLGRWFDAVERVSAARGGPSPVTFCTTCCGETAAAHGDFRDAEQRLHVAVVELERSGARSRCIRPGTRLAELLLDQGRFEEAQRAVGEADDASSLAARARIAVAAGDGPAAVALADRALRRCARGSAASIATLGTLVEALVAVDDLTAAADALARIDVVARDTPDKRIRAQAALARGRIAAGSGDSASAVAAFEAALDHVSGQHCTEAAHAHLALAGLRQLDQPSVARVDAKAALSAFEAVGSSHLADAAAALLRSLGDRSRVGPKEVGMLTKREQEILLLVAQGLTNSEIARRLFISSKTAGNHVSAILAKLGVRSRTEAAAYAAVHATQQQ